MAKAEQELDYMREYHEHEMVETHKKLLLYLQKYLDAEERIYGCPVCSAISDSIYSDDLEDDNDGTDNNTVLKSSND